MTKRREYSQPKLISNIGSLRLKTGLTQEQLAVFVGVTTNTIQNWEKGASGVEQIEKLLKLCVVLDCELSDLIEHIDSNNPSTKGFSVKELKEIRQKWAKQK